MTRQKTLLAIPLVIIAAFLAYTFTIILFTNAIATWRHFVALGLFSVIVYLFLKTFQKALLATGGFLIIGSFNLLTLTPSITTHLYGLKMIIVEIWTPSFQLLSFLLFILFFFLKS